jgi:hypothetical protein
MATQARSIASLTISFGGSIPGDWIAPRQWLLPLPHVPTEFGCASSGMGDVQRLELFLVRGRAWRLRVFGSRQALFLLNVRKLPCVHE